MKMVLPQGELVASGGLRIGDSALESIGYFPFAKLRATSNSLKIKYPFGEVELQRAFVKEVITRWGLFCKGFRFVHSCSTEAPFVLFWAFKGRQVAQELYALGYPINLK